VHVLHPARPQVLADLVGEVLADAGDLAQALLLRDHLDVLAEAFETLAGATVGADAEGIVSADLQEIGHPIEETGDVDVLHAALQLPRGRISPSGSLLSYRREGANAHTLREEDDDADPSRSGADSAAAHRGDGSPARNRRLHPSATKRRSSPHATRCPTPRGFGRMVLSGVYASAIPCAMIAPPARRPGGGLRQTPQHGA